METLPITDIIDEVRVEFQIPPFFTDEALTNYIKEGNAELSKLVENIDYNKDLIARSLLKNYVHYAYFKRIPDFFENYQSNIVSWQMSLIEVVKNVTDI